MIGSAFASVPCIAATASLALACNAFTAVIASATLWRSGTRDAAVYVMPPNVNCAVGKCFCVPAMSACTCAKVVALVVELVLDMTFLLSGGLDDRGAARRA